MNVSVIELSKIIYSQLSKKYQIIFKTSDTKQYFLINLSNKYAKNIAMASENIASASLTPYELFINLLNQLNISIDKILIKKHENVLTSFIYLIEGKKTFRINSHITDSIILSIKTFTDIQIDKKLLLNKIDINAFDRIESKTDSLIENNVFKDNSIHDDFNLDTLKNALKKCIADEKFESAAFLRDRIDFLTKVNK